MKIILGNKRYSSWSLRGWLAAKQSGQAFEEMVIPLRTPEWQEKAADPNVMPSGRVPTLWDDGIAVWESSAIIDWLAERHADRHFWPTDEAARAFARSIAAEMHAGFTSLRQQCPMDVLAHYPSYRLTDGTQLDVERIVALWSEARSRFGQNGDFLFGDFGAADMMYAPVVMRFRTYDVKPSGEAQGYMHAVLDHPWLVEWCAAAAEEPADWIIPAYAEQAAQYA
ncbi:glutathione S-transferase family protein [Pacificimonas sp. ICDLI1SI03]